MGSSLSTLSFDTFPTDLLIHILSVATYHELSSCCQINKLCNVLISKNENIWRSLCLYEWKNKVYVPQKYRKLIEKHQINDDKKDQNENEALSRKAFRCAYLDRMRTVITHKEVCEIKWYFHFKNSHDNDWIHDPNNMTRMVFKNDGVVDIIPNEFTRNQFEGSYHVWKLSGDILKQNEYGNAIQINRYPKEIITRNKTNWGFIVQNHYVIYASYPIPDPQTKTYGNMLVNYSHPPVNDYPFGKAGYIKPDPNILKKITQQKLKQKQKPKGNDKMRSELDYFMKLFMHLMNQKDPDQ